ncbi:hypothetical protein K3495_g12125, partial [Podosphaera aphanis]
EFSDLLVFPSLYALTKEKEFSPAYELAYPQAKRPLCGLPVVEADKGWKTRTRLPHITEGEIKVHWVLSHAGIEGNELADSEAKRGAAMPYQDEQPNLSTAAQNLRNSSQTRQAREKWWNNHAPKSYIRLGINTAPVFPNELLLSRKSLGHLIAARTGHADFANYHVRFKHDDANTNCLYWGEEAEDEERPLDTVSQLPTAIPLGNIHNSTSSSVRLVYIDPDEMGMFPGAPVDKEDWEAQDISPEIGEWPSCQELLRKDNIYWPFRDEKEFSRASYFLKYGLSKGAIDNFPDGSQSFNEFSTTINKIPFGIKTAEGRNEWCTETVSLPALNPGNPNDKFTVRFRRIKPVLEFLLGHKPWDEDLSWAPVRKYCDDKEQRIYDEMHTGNWWWDQQLKLEPGGTLVPIMLASDKTLMTQHSGEKRCWPVYLTVGNLSRAARRRQLDPGMLLIAFLPEYKKDTKGLDSSKLIGIVRQRRRQLHHSSMKVVLQGLKELEGGWLVRCADDNVRHCFPVLGPFICDYEEAVLVTGIKNGQQCALCQATKSDFNKITEEWPTRTHKQTRSQLSKQNERGIPESDPSYIHQHESFAWNLRGANIHESISVDILHQLKKGVFQRLLEQLQAVIKKRVVGGSQFCAGKRKQNESPGLMKLDARFEKMPVYQGLKRFYRFSHHGQTTGEDSQAIVLQIIPAITPLLLVISPDAILFTRAIVDFVLLAQYKSHSDETLKKLSHAIDRIWHMKGSLHEGMARKEQIDELWNQPKFHSLSHYIPSIWKYGAADGIDTAQFEVGHKLFLKKYFGRTNKSKNFEEQIASHNTRAGKMSAFESMLLAHRTTTSVVNIKNKAKVTTVSGVAMTTNLIGCRATPPKICKMLNLSIG